MRRGVETSGAADSSRAAVRDGLVFGIMLNRPTNMSVATPVRTPRCPTGWPWVESRMWRLCSFACHSSYQPQSFRLGLSAHRALSACSLTMAATAPKTRDTVMSPLPSQPLTTARRAAGNCPSSSVVGPRAAFSGRSLCRRARSCPLRRERRPPRGPRRACPGLRLRGLQF